MLIKEFIREKDLKIICEVGVLGGNHAGQILREAPGVERFFLVDPYMPYSDLGQGESCDRQQADKARAQWDETAFRAYRLAVTFPKTCLIRLPSLVAFQLFKDNFFDLVYIDADHSYGSVRADIKVWYPKVKPGGYISGHGYGQGWPEVRRAVNDSFGKFEKLDNRVWIAKKGEDEKLF